MASYYVKGPGGTQCCNITTNSIHIFIINSNTNIFHSTGVGEDIISLAPWSPKHKVHEDLVQCHKLSLTATLKSFFELSLWLRKIWFVSDRWCIWLLASVSKPYLMDDLQHYLFHSPSPVTQNCTIIMDLRADQNMSCLLMTNSCGLYCINLNRCFVLCEFLLWAFKVSSGTCLNIWGILYFIISCTLQCVSVAAFFFLHLLLLTDDYILPRSC